MSKKRFNGARVRVEGERAHHASRVVIERGYTIKQEGRLGDDTGYIIRTVEGPVVNLYDTGSILISGNGRREFGSVEELRPPDTSTGALILASSGDISSELVHILDTWHVPYQRTTFTDGDWMGTVAIARRRGFHIMVLVSTGPGFGDGSRHLVNPEVYFGLGLIIARISKNHFTVVCPEGVQMPPHQHLLGTEIIRYADNLGEAINRIWQRLASAGVLFDAHELDDRIDSRTATR